MGQSLPRAEIPAIKAKNIKNKLNRNLIFVRIFYNPLDSIYTTQYFIKTNKFKQNTLVQNIKKSFGILPE